MKALLRWGLLAVAIAVLTHTLLLHWQEVTHLRLRPNGPSLLALALGITGLAHVWNGWAWSWILQSLGQPVSGIWTTPVYLRTNLWKYLPGNLWHFYGRVRALRTLSIPMGTALTGVMLDPIVMAAAALMLGLLGSSQHRLPQATGLGILLIALHPRCLSPLVARLSRAKVRAATLDSSEDSSEGFKTAGFDDLTGGLTHYPLKPLAGEVAFVLLRGLGFTLAMMALSPLAWPDILPVLSQFSLAWGLGLMVPGAPGGVGVFEAAAVSLLQHQFSAGLILGAVALYRLISTLAEILGYGAAVVAQRFMGNYPLPIEDNGAVPPILDEFRR